MASSDLPARGRWDLERLHAKKSTGGAEAALAATCVAQLIGIDDLDTGHRRDDGLGDAVAAPDREALIAEIDQEHFHLAAIVGIDGAGAVQHGDAMLEREARARAHLRLVAVRQFEDEAGRHQHAVAGIKGERAVLGHGSDQVEARRMRRLIGGQRQAFAVRQTHDPNLHAHSAAERSDDSVSAARARRRAAISSLLMAGQSSVPAPVTRCTMVRSPPMMPVPAETSLATIQSAPLARACSTTVSVSAAKPMTSSGRCGPGTAMVARMSGFWARFSETSPPPSFLSFCAASACARQSATAAAQTAMSAGSASRVASSISCAVSTLMTSTPSGSGKFTGPDTSVTRAPRPKAARASGARARGSYRRRCRRPRSEGCACFARVSPKASFRRKPESSARSATNVLDPGFRRDPVHLLRFVR